MTNALRKMRSRLALVAIVAATVTVSAPSFAASGVVRISIAKAGFIVGIGGGSGTLTFHGRTYRLGVGGVSLGTIGAAQAGLVGRAYNLRRPEDISGTYSAVSASVAVAAGGKVARLQNANGVVLELKGRQVGFELSTALSGLEISLR